MMSESTSGSIFLLFDDLFLYLFSILIWFIFYRIPDMYGLLGNISAKDLSMSGSSKRSGGSTKSEVL